jgi:hypothetical protein
VRFLRARAQAHANLPPEATEQEVHEATMAWAREIKVKRAASCVEVGQRKAAVVLGVPDDGPLFVTFNDAVVEALAAVMGRPLLAVAAVERTALSLKAQLRGVRADLEEAKALLEHCLTALGGLTGCEPEAKAALLQVAGGSASEEVVSAVLTALEDVARYKGLTESAVSLTIAEASVALRYIDQPALCPTLGLEAGELRALRQLADLVTFGVAKIAHQLLDHIEAGLQGTEALADARAWALRLVLRSRGRRA